MASASVCRMVVTMLAMFMLSSTVSADPEMLQDICVADLTSAATPLSRSLPCATATHLHELPLHFHRSSSLPPTSPHDLPCFPSSIFVSDPQTAAIAPPAKV
ncbi:hypothetical protein ACP275_13G043800 [Erythranthe tilingii]